jgi:hypothetical protein
MTKHIAKKKSKHSARKRTSTVVTTTTLPTNGNATITITSPIKKGAPTGSMAAVPLSIRVDRQADGGPLTPPGPRHGVTVIDPSGKTKPVSYYTERVPATPEKISAQRAAKLWPMTDEEYDAMFNAAYKAVEAMAAPDRANEFWDRTLAKAAAKATAEADESWSATCKRMNDRAAAVRAIKHRHPSFDFLGNNADVDKVIEDMVIQLAAEERDPTFKSGFGVNAEEEIEKGLVDQRQARKQTMLDRLDALIDKVGGEILRARVKAETDLATKDRDGEAVTVHAPTPADTEALHAASLPSGAAAEPQVLKCAQATDTVSGCEVRPTYLFTPVVQQWSDHDGGQCRIEVEMPDSEEVYKCGHPFIKLIDHRTGARISLSEGEADRLGHALIQAGHLITNHFSHTSDKRSP